MGIINEIERLQVAKDDLKEAIAAKGVTVPDDAKLDAYPALVDAIDTSEYARPADWIPLPDIENDTEQKIVMLLHIPQQAATDFGFNVVFDSDLESTSKIVVDWGDGTTEEYSDTFEYEQEIYVDGVVYTYHKYDYETIDAPTTDSGEKQVIVSIRCSEDNNFPMTKFVISYNTYTIEKEIYINPSLVREISLRNLSEIFEFFEFSNTYCSLLTSLYCYNIYNVSLSSQASRSIRRIVAKGDNFKKLSLSSAGNFLLDIPIDNQYETVNMTGSAIKELVFSDLSGLTTNLTLQNTYGALSRLVATGITRSIVLSFCGLGRESFVELFQSLTTLPAGSTSSITARNSPGTAYLTDADKAIATQKGWTLTL